MRIKRVSVSFVRTPDAHFLPLLDRAHEIARQRRAASIQHVPRGATT